MCFFAHSRGELRTPGEGGRPSTEMSETLPSYVSQGMDGKFRYKVMMCSVFMEQGFCPRGEHCIFAHSKKQLLEAQAKDPNFKTKLCSKWQDDGVCDRGHTCIFAHVRYGALILFMYTNLDNVPKIEPLI